MNRASWRDRRVFITGHTGFKGGWLTLWLARIGAHVTGYALAPPTTPSLYEQAGVAGGIVSITGDVRDLPHLSRAMTEARPEVVFHLAAQSLVRPSYEDPHGTFDTNVMGTVCVLEAARRVPSVRAIVIVTTDKVYENREQAGGFRERDRLGGHDPYAASKACAELVTDAYRRSFFAATGDASAAAIASARAGNVIGGGDWARDRLVPDAMRAFAAGAPVVIRNPGSTRPWQHVLEPLTGYLTLAEHLLADGPTHATAWNFGPAADDARPVRDVITRLAAAWGDGAVWEARPEPGAPAEARTLELDASHARTRLGWRPRLDLDLALAWVVEWYRGVAGGADPRLLCEAQLDRYQDFLA